MMPHVAFDTLAYANKLKSAGADPKLAEIQAEATAEILNNLINEQTLTKADIKDLSFSIQNLESDVQNLKSDMQNVNENLNNLMNEQSLIKLEIKNVETRTDVKLRNLEMRLHSAFFKMISMAVTILGGLQILFHFVK